MAIKKQFSNFQELISGSDTPILVDFYAPWCGPCQLMSKILDQVNSQLRQQVRIVKINTENYPDLASEHHVNALPTLVLFKQGKPIDRIEGVMQSQQLIQRLQTQV